MLAPKHQNILKIDKNCLRHLSKYFHSSHANYFKILNYYILKVLKVLYCLQAAVRSSSLSYNAMSLFY